MTAQVFDPPRCAIYNADGELIRELAVAPSDTQPGAWINTEPLHLNKGETVWCAVRTQGGLPSLQQLA